MCLLCLVLSVTELLARGDKSKYSRHGATEGSIDVRTCKRSGAVLCESETSVKGVSLTWAHEPVGDQLR